MPILNQTRNLVFYKRTILLTSIATALFSTAACAIDPDVKPDGAIVGDYKTSNVTEYPLWRNCHDAASPTPVPTLADFLKTNPTVFIGKAVERKLTHENEHLSQMYHTHFNGCWVKFKVQQVIQGDVGVEEWVKFTYDDNIPLEEYYNYTKCYPRTGKEYLISGRYIRQHEDGTSNKTLNYVIASKDVSEKPRYTCSPVEKLPEGNAVVSEIRKILEK